MRHNCCLTKNRDELQQILRAFGLKNLSAGLPGRFGKGLSRVLQKKQKPLQRKSKDRKVSQLHLRAMFQKRKSFSTENVRLNCKVKLQMKPLKICFKISCCRRRHRRILGELLLLADKKPSPEGAGRGNGKM